MKTGLVIENDELIYYINNVPVHAGVIKIDGDIYYIGRGGKAVKGKHRVHSEMGNGILDRGFYKFGEDGKLIEGSFTPVKSSRSKKKIVSKIKKRKIKAWKTYVYVIIIFAITMLSMAFFSNQFKNNYDYQNSKSINSQNKTRIELPEFNEEVLICSMDAKSIYDGKYPVREGMTLEMLYRPFEFKYNLKGKSGSLYLSETSDISNATQFILDSEKTVLTVDNLKTGTEYFYKVVVDQQEYTGKFKTMKSTRFVHFPGIENTRDIGGYTTLDGKTVKQGMIIRGTELDGLVMPSYFLDGEYIKYIKNTFDFAYDFDLRQSNLYSKDYVSRLGKDVSHKFYTSPQYGQIFSGDYREFLCQIFKDLAKPNHYPMYLHCTFGVDRTGTICFLLEGVLNLPEEVMRSDYGYSGLPTKNLNPIYSGLEKYKGETIQEKIVDFLTSDVGVTKEEIESIRKILLK